jgi:hypothetical protein
MWRHVALWLHGALAATGWTVRANVTARCVTIRISVCISVAIRATAAATASALTAPFTTSFGTTVISAFAP